MKKFVALFFTAILFFSVVASSAIAASGTRVWSGSLDDGLITVNSSVYKSTGVIETDVKLNNAYDYTAIVNLWKYNASTNKWVLLGSKEKWHMAYNTENYKFNVGGTPSGSGSYYIQIKLHKSDGSLKFNRSTGVFSY